MKFTLTRFNLVLTVHFFIIVPLTSAQFVQQGSKLVGTGAVGFTGRGGSVAISSDGNTAIVGGDEDSGGKGAVWVWTRSGGVWTQQGTKLVGSGAIGYASQGQSVAISSDGNTAIVGGPEDNDSGGPGAIWVWTRSGGVWTQQGNKLVGIGNVDAFLGQSVSLSSDGNTAIAGGSEDSFGTGAAWVWTRLGGVWTQQGNKLVGKGFVGITYQGTSVGLSADGNNAIVGGDEDSGGRGAAWVWIRSGGVWTQQGSKLIGTGGNNNSAQGFSVALSGNGNTAIVSGYGDSGYAAAWVWTRSGGIWTQQGSKLIGTGATSYTIVTNGDVSLSGDGNTAISGSVLDNNGVGAAWIWKRSGGVWSQLGNKLVGSGEIGGGEQGIVSISTDGNTAIVGGGHDNNGIGAAWVFTLNGAPALPRPTSDQHVNLENGKSLQFDLLQKSHVTIQLFNTKGQLVSQLLDETRNAGNYTIPLPAELRGSYDLIDYRAGNYHRTIPLHP